MASYSGTPSRRRNERGKSTTARPETGPQDAHAAAAGAVITAAMLQTGSGYGLTFGGDGRNADPIGQPADEDE